MIWLYEIKKIHGPLTSVQIKDGKKVLFPQFLLMFTCQKFENNEIICVIKLHQVATPICQIKTLFFLSATIYDLSSCGRKPHCTLITLLTSWWQTKRNFLSIFPHQLGCKKSYLAGIWSLKWVQCLYEKPVDGYSQWPENWQNLQIISSILKGCLNLFWL